MKKLISALLVVVMVFAFAGCANNEPTEPEIDLPASALEILQTAWGTESPFFAMGGDFDNMVDNAPGSCTVTGEFVTGNLLVPADQVANLTEVASLMHGMNANTFTGASYRLADGADMAAFTKAMRDAIQGNQWMCGFPEKLVIVTFGNTYAVVFFGHNDAINPLLTNLKTAYPEAVVAYEEAIAV